MSYALMYDSDNETYPDGAQYIAAYVDGSRTGRNYQRARAARPDAKFLLISAVGDVDADVIDIEPGNVWPPENAVDWTIRQRARGANPGYYCNDAQRPQVLAAYAARGVDPGWWWRASYWDRFRSGPPADFERGEAAWQYANPPITGGHWDASIIGPELQAYLDGQGGAPASVGAAAPIAPPAPAGNPGFHPWDGSTFNLDAGHHYGDINGPANSHGGAFSEEKPPIQTIQERAHDLGYDAGPVDGVFGPQTIAAVSAWQRDHLAATTQFYGQVWGDDWAALFSYPAPAPAAPTAPAPAPANDKPEWPAGFGPSDYLGNIAGPANSHGGDTSADGPDVIAAIQYVQAALNAKGYGAGAVDGVFGPQTEAAVAAWQRAEWAPQTQFFGQCWADDYSRL